MHSTAAAQARDNAAIYYDVVIAGIENGNQSDIGAIGHEQGHMFAMPHENCGGQEEYNAEQLRNLGLPDEGTMSLMCNGGNWPNVDPPSPWMVEVMTTGHHCRWLEECDDPNAQAPVTLFADWDYSGAYQDFDIGLTTDLSQVGPSNASSIRIAPNYVAELCGADGCWEVTNDRARMRRNDDQAISIEVTPRF